MIGPPPDHPHFRTGRLWRSAGTADADSPLKPVLLPVGAARGPVWAGSMGRVGFGRLGRFWQTGSVLAEPDRAARPCPRRPRAGGAREVCVPRGWTGGCGAVVAGRTEAPACAGAAWKEEATLCFDHSHFSLTEEGRPGYCPDARSFGRCTPAARHRVRLMVPAPGRRHRAMLWVCVRVAPKAGWWNCHHLACRHHLHHAAAALRRSPW